MRGAFGEAVHRSKDADGKSGTVRAQAGTPGAVLGSRCPLCGRPRPAAQARRRLLLIAVTVAFLVDPARIWSRCASHAAIAAWTSGSATPEGMYVRMSPPGAWARTPRSTT